MYDTRVNFETLSPYISKVDKFVDHFFITQYVATLVFV